MRTHLGLPITIASLLCALGCDYSEPTTVTAPTDLKIIVPSSTLPADGVSTMRIAVANIDAEDGARGTVVVTTTSGTLGNGSTGGTTTSTIAVATSNDTAVVYLLAPLRAATAIITASSGRFQRDTTIQLTTAYPQAVQIGASSGMLDSAAVDTINVTLTRSAGTPSVGAVVVLSAVDVNNLPIGVFQVAVTSDSLGRVSTTFTSNRIDYAGIVTIQAATASANGDSVRSAPLVIRQLERPTARRAQY